MLLKPYAPQNPHWPEEVAQNSVDRAIATGGHGAHGGFLALDPPPPPSLAEEGAEYPEETIGRLMTSEYVAIRPEFTVAEALAHIRRHGRQCETLDTIYVVDSHGVLIDDIRLRDIIMASLDQRVSEIVDNQFIALAAMEDQELAIRQFQVNDAVALPVVDEAGILQGIITVDDVMDVAEQESLEDFQKFGSIQTAIANPLSASVYYLYRTRIVWLSVLVFMNVFSGFAISRFEHVIQSMVALVFFLPLLIDSGGNAGAQSATLMIRALSIGDVQMRDWLKLIGKETIVSLFLGVTMAIGVALVASLRAPDVVVVVAATMVLTVIISSLIGMSLPFLLTKFNLDPATASAPLITSMADITGVLIYFSLASWYFGY